MDVLVARVKQTQNNDEVVSVAFIGNVVDLWERFYEADIFVHLGSDQTSLHIPWTGGYYPAGLLYEESNVMMREQLELFKEKVQASLRCQIKAIKTKLNAFIASVDLLYITIDMDGFSSAYAPGVSAASPLGFSPEFVLRY